MLAAHGLIGSEIAGLEAQAGRETQMSKRVDLNTKIARFGQELFNLISRL